jgi:hypothetical protein
MVAVQDWYFHRALLLEGDNGGLSNCWLEGIAVGFASNGVSIEWRACYSTVEEEVFKVIFDSRFASAAFFRWAVVGDALMLWAIYCCCEVSSSTCSVGGSRPGGNGGCTYLLEDEKKGKIMSADQPSILLRTMVRSLLVTFHSDTAGVCTSPAATNKIFDERSLHRKSSSSNADRAPVRVSAVLRPVVQKQHHLVPVSLSAYNADFL